MSQDHKLSTFLSSIATPHQQLESQIIMPQSPIKETEDPLIGASSVDATSKPTQLTDAQQRGGAFSSRTRS